MRSATILSTIDFSAPRSARGREHAREHRVERLPADLSREARLAGPVESLGIDARIQEPPAAEAESQAASPAPRDRASSVPGSP